jgi:hypothetical protein
MAEHQDHLQLALIDAQERDGVALADLFLHGVLGPPARDVEGAAGT